MKFRRLIAGRLLTLLSSSSSSSSCVAVRNVSGLAAAWVGGTRKPDTLNRNALYRRILPAGEEPSITPFLDKWVDQGGDVTNHTLLSATKCLRRFGRFNHALQVLQWMSNSRSMDLSAGDIAIQLDLISKVHGLEQVEEFFYKLPKELRSLQTYSALLNCYANEMLVEKAEALVQEMTESGISMTSLCYSAMFKLYYQLNDHVKVDNLVQEMDRGGVRPNKFTYGILVSAYGRESDVDGIKKIIEKAESDELCNLDSVFYTTAANWYFRVGHLDKGVESLRKAEKLLPCKDQKDAILNHLLTLYATGGRKDDVLRIWDQCKSYKVYNKDYLCVMTSLLKFDDFEATERILKEWESSNLSPDMHVPNLLITAYCSKGLVEKAESVVNRQVLRGLQPNSYTGSCLSDAYISKKRMPEAVEAIKSAVQVSTPKWKPCVESLAACFSYLIAEKDMVSFEELADLLRSKGFVSEELHRKLLVLRLDGDAVEDALKEDFGASVAES